MDTIKFDKSNAKVIKRRVMRQEKYPLNIFQSY